MSGFLINTNEQNRENPFYTAKGQEVVSIQETFWARMIRQGRYRQYNQSKQAFSATSTYNWGWAIAPEPGMRLYPKLAILSADVSCELAVKIQGAPLNNTIILNAYVSAGTPFIIPFDGEVWSEDGSGTNGIWFGVNNASAAGNLYFALQALEVAYNV